MLSSMLQGLKVPLMVVHLTTGEESIDRNIEEKERIERDERKWLTSYHYCFVDTIVLSKRLF